MIIIIMITIMIISSLNKKIYVLDTICLLDKKRANDKTYVLLK